MDAVQKPHKRYHIYYRPGINLWRCDDYETEHAGLGTSVMDAYWDCCYEVEKATIRPPTISQFSFT